MKEARKMKEEPCGCPGSRAVEFSENRTAAGHGAADNRPELTNWPIQLKLVGTTMPYFNGADILMAADCAAFSTINFHSRFIKGKKVLIGCPKLDNAQEYYGKLTEIFRENAIKSVTVVRMEVPCCGGLAYVVKQAIQSAGKEIPYTEVVIGIKGDILGEGKTPLIPKLQAV
jgi:hypothetical protein